MALNHLKICSKCNTFVWGNIADRSRIIKSVSFVNEPLSKDEAVVSRFFMKPFTSKLTERSKTRHCSIAVKSLLKAINFWLQLGVHKLNFRISDRFKTKLIYEIYDYCDSPDAKPINALAIDNLIALLSRQPAFQFTQVMFALHSYVTRLALPARALALAQQIVTSLSLIIDSISNFMTFMSVYFQTEEDLTSFICKTAKDSVSLREFFENGFKTDISNHLSIGVSNQGVLVYRPTQSILNPPSGDEEIYIPTPTPTTRTLNLIYPEVREPEPNTSTEPPQPPTNIADP